MISLTLPPGDHFVLDTTERVYDQGMNAPTCCAHAVSAAMETRLVVANGVGANEMLVDPMQVFAAGNSAKSLFASCEVAESGVVTPHGLEKATTDFLGPADVEQMVEALEKNAPLMIEVEVGSNFAAYPGRVIYRTEGPRMPHALCVIGFGSDTTTNEQYWIAKNSYGPSWGDSGCVLLRWGDQLVKAESSVHVMRSVAP